jgi:mRNA-degrading endonuclease toxin of MazEF toxin-antitoxin module
MTRRRRYIYRAHLPELHDVSLAAFAERKRVLVISWNAVNGGLRQPVCAVITDEERDRSLPTYVELEPNESGGGVARRSFILCHALHTLTERDLDAHPLGRIPGYKMLEVEAALARALDFRGANVAA